MYILGYSGLDGYIDFKKTNIPDLNDIEKSVGQGMDSAAAIIKDGEIICACAEERFTGKKHTGDFPVNAIKRCLEAANIDICDVDVVAHGFNYEPYDAIYGLNDYSRELYEKILSDNSQIALFKKHFKVDISKKYTSIAHHDCHAAYAYLTSGFKGRALVVVADGLGEADSISIYVGENGILKKLHSYGPESSIGMLYAATTEFLGFYPNSDEYKIMGLAAFGDAEKYKDFIDDVATINDGNIKIKMLFPDQITTLYDRETYRNLKNYMGKNLFKERDSKDDLTIEHMNLAATLQQKTNELMLNLVKYWQEQTGAQQLCLSGGVALNCVTNSYIASNDIFKKIYVPPASADDGTSLGACMSILIKNGKLLNGEYCPGMPFYGPEILYSGKKVDGAKITRVSNEELINKVGGDLLNKKIVAWARGKMEFGPRALGHRSILADPRDIKTKERLNKITKEREMFRPFAPMVKLGLADKFFKTVRSCNYNHMLINAAVRDEYKDRLQAVIHIDGTSRIQTVSKDDLPDIWNLLDYMEINTGIPVVLNTSFNLKGEPIVCFEEDAIRSFINSDIDCMVINDYYFEKIK